MSIPLPGTPNGVVVAVPVSQKPIAIVKPQSKLNANGTGENDESKKPYSKKEARDQAKQKREQQPASEDYAKFKAKELEKTQGKNARRIAHDKKSSGEPDRSKKRLDEDYQNH